MEFVYVVKRYDLFDRAFPHGFVPRQRPAAGSTTSALQAQDSVALWTARIREKGFYLERRQAELDSSFKQIIPYTLVLHGDEVLLLRRLSKGGEARLHGKLSIGVGGHINPIDIDGPAGAAGPAGAVRDLLEAGCRRELEEEIEIRCPYTLEAVGVINDDASDVGSVHFGLVNVARCETADVVIRESEVLEGSFVSRGELAELARTEGGRFETWSALIIERLDEALPQGGASRPQKTRVS
jgi:predicted NUDIX family phosphoesterase